MAAVEATGAVLDARKPFGTQVWHATKRVADIAAACVLLVVLTPLLLAVALAVRASSKGPALFRQTRYGRGLAPFTVLKFRTMVVDADPELHRAYIASLADGGDDADGLKKLTRDPRVTRVGAFLRTTSLDELPQLFNVIAGQMSLVGPRPAIDYELDHYDARHYDRFLVRPGLTGLWQVSGRSELGFKPMLDLDARYARDNSARMDAGILFRTPVALLRRRAA